MFLGLRFFLLSSFYFEKRKFHDYRNVQFQMLIIKFMLKREKKNRIKIIEDAFSALNIVEGENPSFTYTNLTEIITYAHVELTQFI